MKKPTIKNYKGMEIVRIADVVEDFAKWLNGQTMPIVEGDKEPFGWAYYEDFERYMNNKPIVD